MIRLTWLVPVLMLVGCGGNPSPGPEPTPSGTGHRNAATTPAVEVAEVSFDSLDTVLKEQRGKVVLVDFWALWCDPCVAGFPHFVELHKKYADKGLTCISVSMDKQGVPEQYSKDKVLDFLKKQGATFPNFVLADPDKDAGRLQERFGKGPGIPFTVLFDRTGNRLGDTSPTNPKRLTHEQIDKKIAEAVAK